MSPKANSFALIFFAAALEAGCGSNHGAAPGTSSFSQDQSAAFGVLSPAARSAVLQEIGRLSFSSLYLALNLRGGSWDEAVANDLAAIDAALPSPPQINSYLQRLHADPQSLNSAGFAAALNTSAPLSAAQQVEVALNEAAAALPKLGQGASLGLLTVPGRGFCAPQVPNLHIAAFPALLAWARSRIPVTYTQDRRRHPAEGTALFTFRDQGEAGDWLTISRQQNQLQVQSNADPREVNGIQQIVNAYIPVDDVPLQTPSETSPVAHALRELATPPGAFGSINANQTSPAESDSEDEASGSCDNPDG